jgi:DNA-binding CsgD family transcriptional regulator
VARGLINRQIGEQLNMAERTVKIHRQRAMTKLGAETQADLVRLVDLVGLEPLDRGAV